MWRNWRVAGICALLVILVLVVFGRTVGYDFVNYDDELYVYGNPMVSHGLFLAGLRWAFTHAQVGDWVPLTALSHMADCQLYRLWPGGHHLTNVLLHAAAAVLLFLALLQMTGALWRCGFVAALFAIHPLRAESVAWVSGRKDVLSGLFFMLTLLAYARYARRPSWGRYAMVALWLALGLMSKATLMTLPFALLLLDYWPLRRLRKSSQFPRLLLEKLPLLALTAASFLASVTALKHEIAPLENLPLSVRFGNAMIAYIVYLGKLIWPSDLAVLYPRWINGWPAWELVPAIMLLVAVTAWTLYARRKQPYLVVGWLWYLGMLVPVIGIIQTGTFAYADRYTYLSQIGLCVAGAWAAADWTARWRHRTAVLGSIAAAVMAALSVVSMDQTSVWQNSITLWTHTLGCTSDNDYAHNALGNALLQQGRTDEAIAQFREAFRINPAYAEAHYSLGIALLRQGRIDDAIAQYIEALRLDPGYAEAHNNLGNALLQQGRTEEAIAHYSQAVRLNPASAEAQNNLGYALLQQGQAGAAIPYLREALRIDPADVQALYNLGAALLNLRRTDEAVVNYREALRLDPTGAEAHNNLGFALLQQGKIDEAITHLREALRINPDYAEAHFTLGTALFQQGNAAEAISQTQRAMELQPSNLSFENNLAWMLATAPQASLRNGARAVELAAGANQSTGGNNPQILRTLAAAYAQAGDFPNALQTARVALQQAQAQSNTPLTAALRREITLYRAGRPFEEAR